MDLERSILGMVKTIHLNSSVLVVIAVAAVAAGNDAASLEEQASLLYDGALAVLVVDDSDVDSSSPSCWRYVESPMVLSPLFDETNQDYDGADGTSDRRALLPVVDVVAVVPCAVAVLGCCRESGAAVDGRTDRGYTLGILELQQLGAGAGAAAAVEPSSSWSFR